MPLTPREVAEQVRKMVAGEGVVFADLFAADGVLTYPFALPGHPRELRGRDAIRAYFAALGQARALFTMAGVDAVILARPTTRRWSSPRSPTTAWSHVTGAPYG